jgi:nucleoside-diphosphate-sugar epimerase
MKAEKILITGGSGFIGTNLIELFLEKGYNFINLDKASPLNANHLSFWRKGDILNLEDLNATFNEYNPTIVIHLAAKTDALGTTLDYYVDNTKGTENLLEVVKTNNGVKKIVITSTQYVFFPKNYDLPKSDTDYFTHTVYGDSKVITEQLTRSSNLKCTWAIIRPTNVWGPWHIRYSNELLKYIKLGKYVHPGFNSVKKSYAYVKTVTNQIDRIINAEDIKINRQTFYVGDYPEDSYRWANEFSVQMRKKNIIRIPKIFLKLLGIFGDFFKILGFNFPLDSKRYNNMVSQYLAPMDKTIKFAGTNPESFEDNVRETIEWLKNEGTNFTEVKY